MISIDCQLQQNCWPPNFIHVMLRSWVENFGKVRHFTSDSAQLVVTPVRAPAHQIVSMMRKTELRSYSKHSI